MSLVRRLVWGAFGVGATFGVPLGCIYCVHTWQGSYRGTRISIDHELCRRQGGVETEIGRATTYHKLPNLDAVQKRLDSFARLSEIDWLVRIKRRNYYWFSNTVTWKTTLSLDLSKDDARKIRTARSFLATPDEKDAGILAFRAYQSNWRHAVDKLGCLTSCPDETDFKRCIKTMKARDALVSVLWPTFLDQPFKWPQQREIFMDHEFSDDIVSVIREAKTRMDPMMHQETEEAAKLPHRVKVSLMQDDLETLRRDVISRCLPHWSEFDSDNVESRCERNFFTIVWRVGEKLRKDAMNNAQAKQ